MKVVILAGGLGTRLSEETAARPKPMVEIGERPILWHIMKSYSHYGFSDFVVCLGYKGYMIKEYFSNYFLHMSDVTFDMRDNSMEVHQNAAEPWRVTLVDTGAETQTGGRLKRVADYVRDETFMLTYGDGVADIDIPRLLAFHRAHGKLATITAVQPMGRFGALQIDEDETVEHFSAPVVRAFQEKPEGDGAWVNGGFMVLEPAGAGPDRRGSDALRGRTAREPGGRGRAARLPPSRVLAADGRPAGSPRAPGAVGLGRGAVGRLESRSRARNAGRIGAARLGAAAVSGLWLAIS